MWLLVFKFNKTLNGKVSITWKKFRPRNDQCILVFFTILYIQLGKTKYTTRFSVKRSTISIRQSFFQLYLLFLSATKLEATKFRYSKKSAFLACSEFGFSVDFFIFLRFWKHKMHLYDKFSYVDYRAFQAASFGVFCCR